MYQLDNSSGVTVMPEIAEQQSTGLFFTEGGNGQEPSYPGADWFNIIQSELVNVLVDADVTPSKSTLNQLSTAIKKIIQKNSASFAVDSGVANAYVVGLVPALTARTEGQVIRFKVANTSNGACTVNDGVGVVPLVGLALSALQGGEMVAGGDAWIQWHSTVGTGSYVLLFCSGGALQVPAGTKSGHAINSSQITGAVAHFAMSTPPVGWLKCNGAAISRTAYSALYAAIGITFGAGDGSTTFNVPDLRGEFVRGWDDARGIDSGRVLGSSQSDEIKLHTHTGVAATVSYSGYGAATSSTSDNDPISGGQTTAGTGGVETRPRNVAMLACIKY